MNRQRAGFTLIELVVAIAIIGILIAIALPSYQNYIKKSHTQAAGADLVALSLSMENIYQRTLQYSASSTASTANTISYIASGTSAQPWVPSQSSYYGYTVSATTVAYTLTATGVSGTVNSGCTLTLDNSNNRTISGDSACGGLSSW